MSENKNILLCGVGGQGTILASKILSYALVEAGYDVKMSEIHGMSQRGGSVTTQVRYGKKVYSPIIGQGSADILVSFEAMEAYRYLEILNPKGFAVVNGDCNASVGKRGVPRESHRESEGKSDHESFERGKNRGGFGKSESYERGTFGGSD